MPDTAASEWSFNLRSGGQYSRWDCSSDSDSDGSHNETTSAAKVGGDAEETVDYKPNPFSIAKINAAVREQSMGTKARVAAAVPTKTPLKPKSSSSVKKGNVLNSSMKEQSSKTSSRSAAGARPFALAAGSQRSNIQTPPTSMITHINSLRNTYPKPFQPLASQINTQSTTQNAHISITNEPSQASKPGLASTNQNSAAIPASSYSKPVPLPRISGPPPINGRWPRTRALFHPNQAVKSVVSSAIIHSGVVSSPPRATDYLEHAASGPPCFSSPIRPTPKKLPAVSRSVNYQPLLPGEGSTYIKKQVNDITYPNYEDLTYTNTMTKDTHENRHRFMTTLPLNFEKAHESHESEGDSVKRDRSLLPVTTPLPTESDEEDIPVTQNGLHMPLKRSRSPILATPRRRKRQLQHDAYDFHPSLDEKFSTLPVKGKRKPPRSPTQPKRTQKFRIPALTGQLPPGTKTGMSVTSGRRVITFLPPPLEKNSAPEKMVQFRTGRTHAYPSPKKSDDLLEFGNSPSPPCSPRLTPIGNSRKDAEASETEEDFIPLSPPPSDDKHENPVPPKRVRSPVALADFGLDSVRNRYSMTKVARRQRRKLSDEMWELLDLPSCGAVYYDPEGKNEKADAEIGVVLWGGSYT